MRSTERDLFFWCLGSILNVISYLSIEPVILSVVFYYVGIIVVRFCFALNRNITFEVAAYRLVYVVMWFAAGISAVYAQLFDDPSQLNDAIDFYNFSTSVEYAEFKLVNYQALTEGAAVIIIWRTITDFFEMFGFSDGMYVGILVNVLFVSFSSVLAVQIRRHGYGDDEIRIKTITYLFASCGLFWLFSSIYIRDAAVLFFVTLLSYLWSRYIYNRSWLNLVLVFSGSIALSGLFVFLRAEFLFVPVAMFFAAITAIIMFGDGSKLRFGLAIFVTFTVAVIALFTIDVFSDFFKALVEGNRQYSEAVQSNDSLGYSLIVSQPVYIRLFVAPVYLFLSPIPFWSGVLDSSAYHLYKSMNAVFFYFVVPLILLAAYKLYVYKVCRSQVLMFHDFLFVGFVIAISLTSIEARHMGVFLVSGLIVAALPDIASVADVRSYREILAVYLVCIVSVHLLWVFIKLL